MSCNCETYTCLPVAPALLQCGDNILTSLLAESTTNYIMQYEFNGMWKGVEISVAQGEPIEIPNIFNEQYTHLVKFIKPDGDLYENTCYKLDTSKLTYEAGASSSPYTPSGFSYTTVTVTEDGVIIPFVLGQPVVVMDGTQGYISGFTWDGAEIEMTNGVLVHDGQTIGIFYE